MEKEKLVYAGFWIRILAGLMDLLFMLPIIFLLLYCFGLEGYQISHMSDHSVQSEGFETMLKNNSMDIASYLVSIIYLTYFLSKKSQATVGKRVMGIYVGNPDGSQLTLKRALMRALASILTSATLGLGFLPVLMTKEKISLHDFICNTRVFHGKKS